MSAARDPFSGGGATVEQARTRLHSRIMSGDRIDCPVCGQHAALYDRKIREPMARQLRKLYEHGGWMSAEELEAGERSGGDYAKLRFWGVVSGDGAGNWAITPLGRRFVRGECTVPARVYLFDDKLMSVSRERTRFEDCLRERGDDLLGDEA